MKTSILIFIITALLSMALCKLLIFILKKINARQYILGYVTEHKQKNGTPTMCGLAFILSACVVTFAFCGFERDITVIIFVALAFMLIGFLDDFLKIKFKQNLGLKSYQKIIFQVVVAILVAFYCYYNNITEILIPYSTICFNLGFWIIPIVVFVFLATVNSVNLTDGLDGLASLTSLGFFISLGLLLVLQSATPETYLLCFSICGALCGYLIFNINKASAFMGDTGSLALGAFVAGISIFTKNMLLIAVIGIMFVLSSVSDIIQVWYYKKTKKRVFKMAPLHHHFQMSGFSESKISYCYFLITFAIGLTTMLRYL